MSQILANTKEAPTGSAAWLQTEETQLLVSVRSASEAADALAGGADWIDIKEPKNGALGPANPETVADIVQAVGGRRPVTAAVGELREIQRTTAAEWLPGVKIAKVGLSGCRSCADWRRQLTELREQLPPTVQLVAAYYADANLCDAPPVDQVLAAASDCRSPVLLVDTYHKDRGRLLDHLNVDELRRIFHRARDQGLACVAAGSLRAADLPLVLQAEPAVVAVRGAACKGANRESPISRASVDRLRSALSDGLARIS